MKRFHRLSLALLAAIILSLGLVPTLAPSLALADDTPDPITASGTYHFTSIEGTTIQLEDTFEFRESCFKRSSLLGCEHLSELSARAAIASGAVYVDEKDRDCSHNSDNIRALLADMGFTDVEGNNYVDAEKLPNSAGCVVGQMAIKDGSETYTLLAVMPQSLYYKQEWVGDLEVGAEGMHEGFKAGRDEILRYVKSYISDHGITGDLKIWVAGYSRGAALANALGGFFAEGGAGYFEGVTITPENVYCYCYATPRSILQEGLTKAQVLSVAGARGGRYAADTPGEAFTYTGSDAGSTVNPHADIYKCIRNYSADYDLIAMVPPESWGFTYYGELQPLSDGSAEAKTKMLARLQGLSEYVYGIYMNGGDASDYTWKTFDFNALEFVDDTACTDPITQADVFSQRLAGLTSLTGSRQGYANDYQATLAAVGAFFGMGQADFFPALISDTGTAAKAGVFSYLAYASERLQAEGAATSEDQALTIAVEELLAYFTGATIDPATFTADDLLYTVAKFLIDGVDLTLNEGGSVASYAFQSKLAEMAIPAMSNAVVSAIPAEYQMYISIFIPGWGDMDDAQKEEAALKFVIQLLNTSAYGKGTQAAPGDPSDAAAARATIFGLAGMFLGDYPAIKAAVANNGSHNASELLQAALPLFMTVTGTDGTEAAYTDVASAADAAIKVLVDYGTTAVLSSGRYDEGTNFYNDLVGYGNTLRTNASKLRKILTYGLLYTEGEAFDTSANVRNACTFVAQSQNVAAGHVAEGYLAWMGVNERSEHAVTYTTTSGEGNEWTKGSTSTSDFRFSRSEEDAKTLSHFTGITVDGAVVDASNYTTASGSVIVKLAPSYLNTLAKGQHTLVAQFDDGNDPEATFTIQGKDEPGPDPDDPVNPPDDSDDKGGGNGDSKGAPWTGDNATLLLLGAVLLSTGILLVMASRRPGREPGRASRRTRR